MNCGTYRGTLRQTAALQGSVVVAAVMFPFRGTDYGTTASPAKTGVRHQSKGTHGAEHDRRGRRLDQIGRRAQEVQAACGPTCQRGFGSLYGPRHFVDSLYILVAQSIRRLYLLAT
jgi:hypothetical protein